MEGEAEEMIPAMAPGSTFDKLNWLRAGVLTADKLLTVSPNYATEIAEDDEKGVELSGVIRFAVIIDLCPLSAEPLTLSVGSRGVLTSVSLSEWLSKMLGSRSCYKF